MDFSQRQMKSKSWATLHTLLLLLALALIPMTSSSPVHERRASSEEVTSDDDAWLMTSEEGGRSHLLMWMVTEKQLLPRMQALVDSATALLRCTCAAEGKSGAEECLALASSLPTIAGLSDVPSQRVIRSENKRTFAKILMENAFGSLKEVEGMLWKGVTLGGLGQCWGTHRAEQFMTSLQTAATQYQDMMTSFYKSRVFLTGTAVYVLKEEFPSDRLRAIKLLYLAVHHLNQVSAALEYSVEFSWFSRLSAGFFSKGRRPGARRNFRKSKSARQ